MLANEKIKIMIYKKIFRKLQILIYIYVLIYICLKYVIILIVKVIDNKKKVYY